MFYTLINQMKGDADINGWWKCKLCGEFFKNKSSLAHHLATKAHYRERLLEEFGANGSTCPKCGKVMKTQKGFLEHLASVHKLVFSYYFEDVEKAGSKERLDQLPVKRKDLEQNIEEEETSTVEDGHGHDKEGQEEVNHVAEIDDSDGFYTNGTRKGKWRISIVDESIMKHQEKVDVGENIELASREKQFQSAVEVSGGVTISSGYCEDEQGSFNEKAGVIVSYADETYPIESMTDVGQGDAEDVENNVDLQNASHPEELLNSHICQFCDQGFIGDRDFMSHLASAHYWERLKQEYGGDVTKCPICSKVLTRNRATLHHIAEVHKIVMVYYAEK